MGYFISAKVKPKRGEIYWINRSQWKDNGLDIQQKDRPGIIVSSNEINDNNRTYEVVYLTTSPRFDASTHCTIRSTAHVSTALCEEITSVSEEQLGTCLGKCTKEEMATIDACLLISLGLETKKGITTSGQFSSDTAPAAPASTTTAAITMGTDEAMDELYEENQRLQTELAKAEGKAELLLSMYNELLSKTLGTKEFDNPAKNL